MTQRDLIPKEVNDIELWKLIREAVSAAGPTYGETPYGATKTAELNVQFSIDPSFGLTRERYAWYSDQVAFDTSNFDTSGSRIQIDTNADGASSARIRSAYPGQYISHTIAEPGLGAELDPANIETTDDGIVTLTHGEISLEAGTFDQDTQTGINAHGISFEEEATYHQVRVQGSDVAKIPQSEWNIDTFDGTGPSGEQFEPQNGYVYQFIYSWYGEGAMILAVQDPEIGQLIPLNSYVPQGIDKPPVSSPNLPLQCIIQNQGTADPLHATLGGMQYATHGEGDIATTTRATEEARHPGSGFITENVVLTDEVVDPYQTTMAPLVAAKRDPNKEEVEKGLRFEVEDTLVDADSPLYVFVFDEFDEAAANLDGTFNKANSRGAVPSETNIFTNTTATTYEATSESVIRSMAYIPSSKNDPASVTKTGTSSRIPLTSTVVIAAALAPGANNTTADPVLATFREGY